MSAASGNVLDRFEAEKQRYVSHSGEKPWLAVHTFELAAPEAAIQLAEKEIGLPIPLDLKSFWKRADGARLFESTDEVRWGWLILSTRRYLEGQHKWRRKFFDHWRTNLLVVAELVEPSMALVWDGSRIMLLWEERRVMKERVVAASFSDLLAQLDAADGGLWWAWA